MPFRGFAATMAAMSEYAIEASGLAKSFGDLTAVTDVSLRVPRGSAFGFLGPNGAGKTTVVRMLLGLTRADEGNMELAGLPVPERRREALAHVGAIIEEPLFHRHLSGRENLEIVAAARGREAFARIAPALERVGLTARARDRVSGYSLGMRQRLGIARCLLADPELLLLDEPMNGLDPAGIQEFRALVRELVDEGRTVFVSSHLLDEIEKTCDHVAIIDRGRTVIEGAIAELIGGESRIAIGCDAPARAALVLGRVPEVVSVSAVDSATVAAVTLGDERTATAAAVRALVDADVGVHRVEPARSSLEDRFMEITTRLQEAA
jgi:ABC-2 type transport system ATP-binding protein